MLDIEISDTEKVTKSCKATKNLENTLRCTIAASATDGSHLLTVTNAFPSAGLSKDQEFKLTIADGMYTPLSMKTSDSFHVLVTDAENHLINY